MNPRESLLRYCIKYENDGEKVFEAISKREDVDETIDISEYNFITLMDNDYPEFLKRTASAHKSFVLYYEGDKELLNNIEHMIFLYGENKFNLPEEKLITIEYRVLNNGNRLKEDCVLNIGGRLKIWFNKEPENPHCFMLAAYMCQKMVITKEYPLVNNSFIKLSLSAMLENGGNIYVTPTKERSWNNQLIKDGAFLIDCAEDLEVVNKW